MHDWRACLWPTAGFGVNGLQEDDHETRKADEERQSRGVGARPQAEWPKRAQGQARRNSALS